MEIMSTEGFEFTGIDGISLERFLEAVEKLEERMEMGGDAPVDEADGNVAVTITYRDSCNYKYDFALQLNEKGQVLMIEPDWYEDEKEERDLLLSIICEEFQVSTNKLY